MDYKGLHKYPKILDSIAEELAILRSELSKNVYNENTDKYRGEQELEISTLGILGELVARDYLLSRDIKHEAARLVDLQPVVGPDIITYNDSKIDVKGVKEYGDRFYINYDAHRNSNKECDFYWFVKINKQYDYPAAKHFIVSSKEVNKWNVEQLRYTKAFVSSRIE
tara:strand:+ start:3265 stop:3765 length:501 start_codon:yes stop_codon:yes gene_type:complete